MKLYKVVVLLAVFALLLPAGSIFLTGHDPDFHALLGGNATGAQNINKAAISYITDPGFNPYKAGGVNKWLFVQSNIVPPAGHVNGKGGITASGYVEGTDFDQVDASGLNAALDLLGTTYNGIVVASDFGGILTQAELDILVARSADIITFLNKGGGLYAMAEGNNGAGLTPNGGWFKFLPFIVTSTNKNQNETGFTVTPYGLGLGLTDADVNGNASHNIFNGAFGMNIVDIDAQGQILSLATRSKITGGGVVPEPSTVLLLGCGLLGLSILGRRLRP